jgi:hypothetical protein
VEGEWSYRVVTWQTEEERREKEKTLVLRKRTEKQRDFRC